MILPARPRCPFLLPLGFLATLCVGCSAAPPLLTLAPQPVPVPSGPPRLETGAVQEREIRAGETHEHRIAVQAGDYVRVTVDQTRADVALRLVGPSGAEIAAQDGAGGRKEEELISWIAPEGGDFRLLVAS